MGLGNLWLRRSASMLACSVRSISIRPSLVHKPYCPVRPFVSYSTAANASDDDDWISSEKAVIREIDAEYNAPAMEVNENNVLECFLRSRWNDRSRAKWTLPDNFPFKIEDIPGSRTLTFTREYNGEHIKVVLSMLECDDDDDDDEEDDDSPSKESNDDDDAPSNESDDDDSDDDEGCFSPLVVTVTKQSGRVLELCCNLRNSKISIEDIHVYLPGNSSEDPKVLRDMDDSVGMYDHTNLKEAFNKYLKVRGLDESTITDMDLYMSNKMKLEYWSWLDSLKEFLEE